MDVMDRCRAPTVRPHSSWSTVSALVHTAIVQAKASSDPRARARHEKVARGSHRAWSRRREAFVLPQPPLAVRFPCQFHVSAVPMTIHSSHAKRESESYVGGSSTAVITDGWWWSAAAHYAAYFVAVCSSRDSHHRPPMEANPTFQTRQIPLVVHPTAPEMSEWC